MDTSLMQKKLIDWLRTQSKEFVDEIVSKDVLGDGYMTIEELCELDKKYIPEE